MRTEVERLKALRAGPTVPYREVGFRSSNEPRESTIPQSDATLGDAPLQDHHDDNRTHVVPLHAEANSSGKSVSTLGRYR